MVRHKMQPFLALLRSVGKVLAGAFGGFVLSMLLMYLHIGLTPSSIHADEGLLGLFACIILVPVGAYVGLIWARW